MQVEGRLKGEIDTVAPEAVIRLSNEFSGFVRDIELFEGDSGMGQFDDGFDLRAGITAVRNFAR